MKTVETSRLLLRPYRNSDLDAYAEMCADAETMRFIGGKPLTRIEAWRSMAAILGHWVLQGYGLWAVEERSSGKLVGRVGCLYPDGWPGFEVGWTIAKPYRGRGYATEAARASIDYAFRELGRDHIISLIHPDNTPSIRVAERLGEKLEGETDLFGTVVRVYGLHREIRGQSR